MDSTTLISRHGAPPARPGDRHPERVAVESMGSGKPAPRATVTAAHATSPSAGIQNFLWVVSVITMLMAVPQVLINWIGRDAGGASLVHWAAYLFCACLWFAYGIRDRDRTMMLACAGWIALNAAIVIDAIAQH
jgi:uncharacterized protein with PQ loop repeat